jgi:hypothetical protein
MNDKENSINISESEDLLHKSGYVGDNNNWSNYTFLGKLLLLFGIVCLFCFMIIVISFTIVAVRAWL